MAAVRGDPQEEKLSFQVALCARTWDYPPDTVVDLESRPQFGKQNAWLPLLECQGDSGT